MESFNLLPLLTIIVILLSSSLFVYFNFDFLQPTIVFFFVMSMSLLLGTLNIDRWNLYVGSETSLIVIGGMLAFAIGAGCLHYNFYKKYTMKASKIKLGIYDVPWQIIILCTIVTLSLAYLSTKEMYALSVQLGNHDGIMNMIKTLRYPLERGEITFSRMNSYRNLIAMLFATTFLYMFINNLIVGQNKVIKNLLFLLPVFSAVPFFILSTGRRSMVHFIICGLVLAVIIYQQKYGINHEVRIKILRLLGCTAFMAFFVYFALGFLTGKVSIGGRDPLTIIAHYGGLSVPALEQYVSSCHPENQYIMQNTMMGFYGNLNSLGFHLETGRGFLPFVEFHGTDQITTNVYTIFYRLIADYSIPGMLVIMFLFGVLLTYIYNYLRHNNSPGILAIYAYFGYIPFFLFIDDQFMGLFRTRTIYFCLLISGFIYLLRRYYFHYTIRRESNN